MQEKILLALIAGLFGLIPLLLQWLSNRSKAKSKENHLAKLSNQLNLLERIAVFSKEHVNTTESNSNSRFSESLQNELEAILKQYKSLRYSELEENRQPTKIPGLRRMFLFYKPTSFGGWVTHTLFYMITIMSIAVIIGDYELTAEERIEADYSFSDMLLGMFIIMGPALLILQRGASYFRKKTIAEDAKAIEDAEAE